MRWDNTRQRCVRCSTVFHIFASDPAYLDQLCTGCNEELRADDDIDTGLPPPSVPYTPEYIAEYRRQQRLFASIEDVVDALDSLTE